MDTYIKFSAVIIATLAALLSVLSKIGDRIHSVFSIIATTLLTTFAFISSSSIIVSMHLFKFENWDIPAFIGNFGTNLIFSLFNKSQFLLNICALTLITFIISMAFTWKTIGFKFIEDVAVSIAEDAFSNECDCN